MSENINDIDLFFRDYKPNIREYINIDNFFDENVNNYPEVLDFVKNNMGQRLNDLGFINSIKKLTKQTKISEKPRDSFGNPVNIYDIKTSVQLMGEDDYVDTSRIKVPAISKTDINNKNKNIANFISKLRQIINKTRILHKSKQMKDRLKQNENLNINTM